MKKILSILLLFFMFFSGLQVPNLYAYSVSKLELEKEKNSDLLDKTEDILEKATLKIWSSLKNKELKEKLEEKKKEIKETIEEAKEKIEKENSKKDIKEITDKAKKTAVLKIVSWVTKDNELKSSIDYTVAKTNKQKKRL